MSLDIADLLSRYAAGRYKPATFLERGIALPFTTPHLLGGRIRPGDRRAPELVLANPAGAEGVYVLPWSALPDFCPPTIHDRAIWSQIGALQMLTPRSVLAVTRRVAAQGYAGREAASAAASAAESQEQQRILLHYHLLLELVRQGEPPDCQYPPPERDSPANVERRARAVLEKLKSDRSLPPTAAVEALEELAMAFETAGLRNNPTGARLPLLCAEIAEVVRQVVAWGDAGQEQERQAGKLLAQASELALRGARAALMAVYEQQRDLWALLHRWRVEPRDLLSLLERPEWLLDGWDLICALWRTAERTSGPAARRAAAFEMAGLVPVLPQEAQDWLGFDAPSDMDNACAKLRSFRRTVRLHQDWMSGRMMDLALRNEHVRALAA